MLLPFCNELRTDLHRVWYGLKAEEERRISEPEVNEKLKVKNEKLDLKKVFF
jgi:hypothetical protein